MTVGAGALPGLAGCAVGDGWGGAGAEGGGASPTCVPRSTLEPRTALAGHRLVYDVDGRGRRFWFDPGFAGQLDAWLEGLAERTGLRTERVWTYGSWIDGGSRCDSWHHAGRGFDLSRLEVDGRFPVSCRYDLWRDGDDADLLRRRYWAVAASLHRDFAHVLTYLWDAAHHNHVHVDNGRSGSGLSRLRTRSRAQVQAVQAMCTHLWDRPVETSGAWDGATREATGDVLAELDLGDDLADPSEDGAAWHGFLEAGTARFPG